MEFKGIKQNNMSKVILMKVTSRQRKDQLIKTIKSYISMANNTKDMVWLFSFDVDDWQLNTIDFSNLIQSIVNPGNLHDKAVLVLRNSEGKIDAINRDIADYPLKWDIILNISDDQIPIVKGYDDKIRCLMPDDLDYSLWFNDGAQPRLNTQEIVGRKYYERFNYIYHPSYKSLFCDNEAHEVAVLLGRQIKSKECIIKHFHPGHVQGVKTDALYQKNESYWNIDEANFKERKKINFGL
jgi:hypothetical protein